MDEIGEMTREQELAFELRDVKHDLETVVEERDRAHRERDRYRQHSITLNTIGWKTAEALGEIPEGADRIEGNPPEQTDRLIAKCKELDGADVRCAEIEEENDRLHKLVDDLRQQEVAERAVIEAARTFAAIERGRTPATEDSSIWLEVHRAARSALIAAVGRSRPPGHLCKQGADGVKILYEPDVTDVHDCGGALYGLGDRPLGTRVACVCGRRWVCIDYSLRHFFRLMRQTRTRPVKWWTGVGKRWAGEAKVWYRYGRVLAADWDDVPGEEADHG